MGDADKVGLAMVIGSVFSPTFVPGSAVPHSA